MKSFNLKAGILFLLLALGTSFSSMAQVSSGPVVADDAQPMMLVDNQLTFYDVQLDFASILIAAIDGSDAGDDVVTTISEDGKTLLLDFSGCVDGEYLIVGTREELELHYIVERK